LAEWLYEAGIGEARAALVDEGRIVKARIERAGVRLGTVLPVRLVERMAAGQGRAAAAVGAELLVDRLPPALTEGATLTVRVTREAIPEPGRAKLPRAVPADADAVAGEGADLLARITASGLPVRHAHAHEADALEAAGWSEVLAEAQGADISFSGPFPAGVLRMSPTPAMTLFDVDGTGAIAALAVAAAKAVAQAIVRHGIGGSIGIDFPSVAGRAERQAVAAAIDAALPPPFERTALNGFGFLQIVRPRPRASLPEILRADPAESATLAVLRQLERTPPGAPRHQRVPAIVLATLARHPDWRVELDRRTGGRLILEA